jgi:phage shock protein A
MLFNTIDGIVFALLRMLPDSILIARIESQSARKQAEANEALVELGTLTAKFERETKEAKPLMDRKEAEIKALLAQGKEEAAASLMEEFETLEADYNEKKQAYDTSKAEFEVRVKEANIYLDKLQKRLRSIKNNSARTKAEEKLNNLRKAVSEKRFDIGGLNDDLNLLDERIKDRGDRVRGTSMVLDQDTKATAANVKVLEETRDAMNKSRLARFAADRNIQLSSSPRTSEPAPLGTPPAAAEPENKEKA